MVRFYPNKWNFLFIISIELLIFAVIMLALFTTDSTYSESMPYVIALIVFGVVIGIPFAIRATFNVYIDSSKLIIKRNLFSRKNTFKINDINIVLIEYRKSKTITINTNDNKEIRFDCTINGLTAIIKHVPESKIKVFYVADNFVPKKHRELLVKTKILKKGKHRGYLK